MLYAAVATELILKIRRIRADKIGIKDPGEAPVRPDGTRRAYILDSIRHPAEVQLLRHVYQEAFVLVVLVRWYERMPAVRPSYAVEGHIARKSKSEPIALITAPYPKATSAEP
jgi:hypothetical protein